VRFAIFVSVLVGAVLAVARIRARRARQMRRVLITPGRTSEASPVQVAGLVEALCRVTRDRWWLRALRGTPPAATLELVSGRSPEGNTEQRIGIAIPSGNGQLEALRGIMASRYPDSVLTVLDEGQSDALKRWLKVVVCLQKARPFTPVANQGERGAVANADYPEAPLDVVLSVMAETKQRVLVQVTVTPAPNIFQRWMRGAAERPSRQRERGRPGAVEQREERSVADTVVFRPLSFCDIRVGAETYRVASQVAGAIEGVAEGAENQLRQRCPVLRRRLYIDRMVQAEPNPVASLWSGVYSSLEIAQLWHLPTPFAKDVAIRRSNVPQLPAPPEVLKLPDDRRAIARDLQGTYVGIRPEDYKYGLQVSGMAGGGKTSILAKVAEARAREPNTALVILDPKGELAEAAAAQIPTWRTVRFLDFSQPLFGLALRTLDRDLQAEAAIFSEAMVDVSRTEEGESQALNASQRSFRMARQATLALEEDPTFWHTARWLAADDSAAEWRAEKISRLAGDPEWHGVWDHFARILPAQLKKSPTQAVMRMEAPFNKIQTLLADQRLNTVLHHPVTVSIDDVIRRREVLIVAARVPEHPDADVLLKFAMQILHRAILAQQSLPEDERARVAVIGDDAGYLFSPTIARMLEHDRSAGLDMALGWQHGGQVTPELALAIDGLCNSRIYLRSAEEDARRVVNRLNPAYEDRMTAVAPELRRKRVEVNQLTSLEVNHAVAVLQAGKSLSNSFTVETLPWVRDPKKLALFEKRIRAEGAYDPEVVAPPQELTGRGQNVDLRDVGAPEEEIEVPSKEQNGGEGSDRVGQSDAGQGDSPAAADPSAPAGSASPRSMRRGVREAEVADLGAPTNKSLSEGYQEVELLRDKVSSINWEEAPKDPPGARAPMMNVEKRSILEALYELRVVSGAQIQRDFLMAMSERQARRELNLLFRHHLVKRFELGVRGGRGRGKRAYVLDVDGYEALRTASDHYASGTWRVPELRSPQHVVHDLQRNEWLFAFRSLAPKQLAGWRGPRTGKIEVPLVREPREAPRRLSPLDLGENAPIDLGTDEFANIIPDLTLELALSKPSGEAVRTDLLVEIEFGNNDETVRRKALEYDGFLTGWWRRHKRYEALGRPPIVFFVVPNVERAKRFIELLDETLLAYLVGPAETQTKEQRDRGVTPTPRHLYLGRRNIFVAVARDVHQRTLRSWRVPAEPVDARTATARSAGDRRRLAKSTPRSFVLIDPRDLVNPAR
jgi:protein involved in plasmid replication-relaxation